MKFDSYTIFFGKNICHQFYEDVTEKLIQNWDSLELIKI